MARSRTLNFILAADARQVTRAFNQADKAAGKTAKVTEHAHGRMGKAWHSTAGNAVKAAAGVTAAYVSISKAHEAIEATEELAKTTQGLHRNLGLSVKEASRWGAVAKARDIDSKSLTMSFTALSRQVTAANEGGDKQQKIFSKLGLTHKDLKKGTHDFSGLVTQLADGFGKLHGGTERQAAAQALLGRGYQSVLPLFAEGSKSLKEQLHWADQYGVTLNSKTIKPLNDLIKSQRELKVANLGLKAQFTKLIAPGLLEVEHAAERVLKIFNDPKLTGKEKWEKVGKIVGPIASKIGDSVTAAIPKIADAVGKRVPMVASAFVKGFAGASVWGKLAIGAFLLSKMGGLGAFSRLGGGGGGAAAKGFGARFKTGLRGVLKGIGIAAIINGAITAAATKGRASDKLQNFFSGFTGGLVPEAGVTRLKQTNELLRVFNARVGNFNPAKIHNAAGQLRKLADTKLGHDWFDHGKLLKAAEDLDHLGQRSQILRDNIGRMRKGSVSDVRELRRVFAKNMADISEIMGTRSKQGAKKMAQNTDAAIHTIKGFMRSGVTTTRRGMAEIERIFEAEARAFGISPKSARESAHVKAFDLAHGDPRGGRPAPGAATGGWIGSPGEAGGDNVPIVVGRGEAVLNRHQQAPVEMALRSTYGMGLDDLFAQVQRPHYMAKGGKAGKYAYGGVVKPVANLIRKLDSMGFHHGSTTGGGHAPNSYHYRGMAVDYGDANNDMQRLWSAVYPQRRQFAELFGPSSTKPGPHLMHNGAGFSSPSLQAQHENHIHMALSGAFGGVGGMQALKRLVVKGPNSYVKTVAQGALDVARRAANARLSSLQPAGTTGEPGGMPTGNYRGPLNRNFGARSSVRLSPGQVRGLAQKAGLPGTTFEQIAHGESNYMPGAVSPDGGYGLWQMTPRVQSPQTVAAWHRIGSYFNPWKNALMAKYLYDRAGHTIRPWFGTKYVGRRTGNAVGRLARGGRVGRRFAGGGFIPRGYPHGPRPTRGSNRLRPHRYSGYHPPHRGPLSQATRNPLVGDFPGLMQPGTAPEPMTVIDVINQSISDIQLQADAGLLDQNTAAQRIHSVRQFAINSGQLGDRDKWQLMADDLSATAQATEDNTAAIQAQTDAMNGLKDELKRQNDFAKSVTAVNGLSAVRALADVLAGNLGPRVQQRIQSPSFGAVARA